METIEAREMTVNDKEELLGDIMDELKKENMSQAKLARLFNLTDSVISTMKNKKYWHWINPEVWQVFISWKKSGLTFYEYSDYLSVISFDEFWNLYDKKVGDIDKVKLIWFNLSEEDKIKIISFIPKYIETRPDKYYRKDPIQFLTNKCWNDELIKPKKIYGIADYSDIQLTDELVRRGYSGELIKKIKI